MSKAFFREDTVPEEEVIPLPISNLPPGTRNFVTAEGIAKLQLEITSLLERRSALGNANDPEKRSQATVLEHRIRHVQNSLKTAETPARSAGTNNVQFGARVKLRDAKDELENYRIVGVDEAAPEANEISWLSPLARALQQKKVGDVVTLQGPRQTRKLEVVEITY